MEQMTNESKKSFDTVKFFRAVKEKIAKETSGMSFEQLKEYLNQRQSLRKHQTK